MTYNQSFSLSGIRPLKIVEFTGRKDKNDKEIYEGDKNSDSLVCEWDDERCAFVWVDNDGGVAYFGNYIPLYTK